MINGGTGTSSQGPTVRRPDVMPPGVSLELARTRPVLDAALGTQAADALADCLAHLRSSGADAALLTAIVRRLPVLSTRLAGPGGVQAWLTAVREVATQAPHCTLALLESSEDVLRDASPAELLTWARLGLRSGHDPSELGDAVLAHFSLRSRTSAWMPARDGPRVDFAANKPRLVHLLRALFDMAPALLPVEQGLATRRPFLSNLGVHLPEAGRALRGAGAQRWYEAAAAHAAAHLRFGGPPVERGALKPVQTVLFGLLEDARVEALAVQEMPGLRRLWLGFHTAHAGQGEHVAVLMLRLARALLDSHWEDAHPWVAKARHLFLQASDGGRAPGQLRPEALRVMASHLGNDLGQMRLQFNHREHVIEPSYRDDNAHLWVDDHENTAKWVASTDPSPQPPSTVQPAAGRDTPVEPALTARHQYPEWDRLVGDYRSAWTTVLEGRPRLADPHALKASIVRHADLLQRLERVLRAGRLRERVTQRAQLRGDALDLDAAVRSAIDRRSHHAPGEKVHLRQVRRERDVAALVLLDCSTSTADPCASGGTVLDLAREAALLTTLTLVQAGDRCAMHAFCSNGRHEVRYDVAIDFGEALDHAALSRLAGLHSHWSTRMGAALRHATGCLAAQPQRRRLLLFITDGEPHDIDIHDRRYLVDDARRSVLEAARRGIAVFCVALDPAADGYVRTIFGSGNYRVLDRIDSLPQVLPAMVMRLTR